MRQQKLLWIALIIMILINLIWLGNSFWGNSNGHKQHKSFDFIAEELELSAEQKEKITTLRESHFENMMALRKEEKKLKDEYFKLAFEEDISRTKELRDQLNKLNEKLEILTFDHFREFKEVLNEDQIDKLQSVMKDILRPAGGAPGGPPPGQHGPPNMQHGPPPGQHGSPREQHDRPQ